MIEHIYFIRHGLTDSNKKKIYSGWNDDPLTSEGIAEVNKVGERLTGYQIEKIISSPVRRASQTAEILDKYLDVGIKIEKTFAEMRLGLWEGVSEEEIARCCPIEWEIWNSHPSRLNLPGRETLTQLEGRALEGIKRISDNGTFNKVLVVTHVALIRVLFIHFNEINIDLYRTIDVPNGSVFHLDSAKLKIERII